MKKLFITAAALVVYKMARSGLLTNSTYSVTFNLSTTSIMMSIANILIIITVTVAISGEALVSSIDKDRSGTRVSLRDEMLDMLPRLKRTPSYDKSHYMFHLSSDGMILPPLRPDPSNIKTIVSKHGSLRKQRPVLVETKGSDDGATSSSSPLRNRFRRSPSKPDMPANNNTTAKHTMVVNKNSQMISNNKHLLLFLLTALTNPYFVVVPKSDYEYRDDFYA